jgi:hypothetical protein
VSGREVGLGERQDDPALDDLLGLLHALEVAPQPRIDHPSAQLGERGMEGDRCGNLALQVHEIVRRTVAATLKPFACRVSLRGERGELSGPSLDKLSLQVVQDLVADLLGERIAGKHLQTGLVVPVEELVAHPALVVSIGQGDGGSPMPGGLNHGHGVLRHDVASLHGAFLTATGVHELTDAERAVVADRGLQRWDDRLALVPGAVAEQDPEGPETSAA